MEHNTDRILWTVLVLAIGVTLYISFKGPANGILGQSVEKIQTIATNVNSNKSDSSNTKSNSNSSSSDTTVGPNLYADTQNFNNLTSWWGSSRWTKAPNTYKGLSVVQTTDPWNGLSQYIHVKKGDVLTYSTYARYTSGTGTSTIYWQLNNQTEGSYSTATVNQSWDNVNITDSWQRVSGTAVATSDGYLRPRLERGDSNANTLQIAGIKVEKGSKATPYTP